MTLLELTVVILVILTMVNVLFFGAQAWKRGSDRAICIVNIQTVQKSMRSYANLYGFSEGSSAPMLKNKLIGLGKFVESDPECPGNGSYSFGATYGADSIPPAGSLYMTCDLSSSQQHEPKDFSSW
jgi:type II secretory pathway pseudopilin PulG